MTRVHSESGAINILNVIIMLVLLIALGFAFELSRDPRPAERPDK